jgi:hypothetical protein
MVFFTSALKKKDDKNCKEVISSDTSRFLENGVYPNVAR